MRFQVLGGVAAVFLAGCTFLGADRSPVVARGPGLSITLEELDARVKQMLLDERTGGSESKLYELRSDALDDWIEEQVLLREAERRGLDVDALLEADAEPVSEDEVQAFFDENAARLPPDTQLADVEEPIRRHLRSRKLEAVIEELVRGAQVEVSLEPPRLEVAAVGPSRGPDDAPVTIIEFGDFECPYCRRAAPVVKQVLERYPDQVRLVYRHLPLETIHPRARAAAEASACAEQQGRFWEFHDLVYASRGGLGDAELRAHAEAAGVALEPWDACLASGAQQERITLDIEAAREAGINGTPAFLVNGVLLTGAHPLEVFARLIERDLAAAEAAR